MKHTDVEPSLEGRSELEQLTDYVHCIIHTMLEYEKSIPGFSEISYFPGVQRLALLASDDALPAAIFTMYESAFTRSVKGRVTLGLPGIRTNFRVCKRILDYLAEHQEPSNRVRYKLPLRMSLMAREHATGLALEGLALEFRRRWSGWAQHALCRNLSRSLAVRKSLRTRWVSWSRC